MAQQAKRYAVLLQTLNWMSFDVHTALICHETLRTQCEVRVRVRRVKTPKQGHGSNWKERKKMPKLTRYVTSLCGSTAFGRGVMAARVCVYVSELVWSVTLPGRSAAIAVSPHELSSLLKKVPLRVLTVFSPLPLHIRPLINDPPLHSHTTQSLCIWENKDITLP